MLKRPALFLAFAASVSLFGFYLHGHGSPIRAAYRHMFVRQVFVVKREIVVWAPQQGVNQGRVSQSVFDSAALSPELLFYANITLIANLACPVDKPGQKTFFIQCGKELMRPWKGCQVMTSETWHRMGQRARCYEVDALLDEESVKVVRTRDHEQLYVFYGTQEGYEKALKFIAYLRVVQFEPRVSFTTGVSPISSIAGGEEPPFGFLRCREIPAFVFPTGQEHAQESRLGSLLLRGDGRQVAGTYFSDRYGDLAVRRGPQGTLDLCSGDGTLVARFTDYGFNCGDAFLLYGTFFVPDERRGYLAVKCDPSRARSEEIIRKARCLIEAEGAGDPADTRRVRLHYAYGGQVLYAESRANLRYRFDLAEDLSGGSLLLRYSAPEGKAVVTVIADGSELGTVICERTWGTGDFRIVGVPIGHLSAGAHTLVIASNGAVTYDCLVISDAPQAPLEPTAANTLLGDDEQR